MVLTSITQDPIYDIIATLLIGVILYVVAAFLAYMTKRLLIGQSASPRVEAKIRAAIEPVEGVEAIIALRTLHMGGETILLNLEIAFVDGLVTDQLEAIIDTIEERVTAIDSRVKHVYIEAESFKKSKTKPAPETPEPAL